jgi:hypothetical protein
MLLLLLLRLVPAGSLVLALSSSLPQPLPSLPRKSFATTGRCASDRHDDVSGLRGTVSVILSLIVVPGVGDSAWSALRGAAVGVPALTTTWHQHLRPLCLRVQSLPTPPSLTVSGNGKSRPGASRRVGLGRLYVVVLRPTCRGRRVETRGQRRKCSSGTRPAMRPLLLCTEVALWLRIELVEPSVSTSSTSTRARRRRCRRAARRLE